MQQEGMSFMEVESPQTHKGSKVKDKIKTAAIVVILVVVLALAIKVGVNSSSSCSSLPKGSSEASHFRPLHPGLGNSTEEYDQDGVCLSKSCITAAHNLFQNMDLSADPCQDFNQFACGKFIQNKVIPEEKSTYTGFTPVSETIYARARNILEEPTTEHDWDSFKKAKALYQSCMDEDTLEKLGLEPLQSALRELGGWPVLLGSSWDPSAFTWYNQMLRFNEKGFSKNQIVSCYVAPDYKNSSRRVIFLDQPNLGMSREYLIKGFDDPDVQEYYRFMIDAAKLLGMDFETTQQELKESLELEIDLALISAPREERRDRTKMYNKFLAKDIESLPGHPPSWASFIDTLIFDQTIGPDEPIIVKNPEYMADLSTLLTASSPRTISNYLGWRVVKSMFQFLNHDARAILLRFNKALTGVKVETPRWKFCANLVGFDSTSLKRFEIPIGSMYAMRHFSSQAKSKVLNLIQYLRKAFKDILDDIDWMDEVTRGNAQEKLTKIAENIAYPEEMLEQSLVDGLYTGLLVHNHSLIDNLLNITLWKRQFDCGRLRDPVLKRDWIDQGIVAVVNAFYNPFKNLITFPAGILQGHFFDDTVPMYLNFGAIGGVIGHEITHGFDDRGRQFDGDGNLRDWWAQSTKDKFVEKTNCIIHQYGNYTAQQIGMQLNGVTTQGENIADNGGLKEAYYGYEKWLSNHGQPESKLPGLGFNPKQLFWISWGQVWCAKWRDEALKKQIKTGAHSPNKFRIIGPLSNFDEFSIDFKCQADSPMNPQKKCQVW
eukprot:TCALIF_12236-PA protein Name:"Similar to Mmel1 Membrane metallo-endopeptidase-like 1 (Mus musculus)" AED:0.04 eAED:0.04 QI:0/0.66/0.25/0.75/1/1/4/0/771